MCRMFCPRTERCITSILLQCTIIVTNESQSSNTYVHYKYTRKLFNAGNLRSQIRRENGSENGHNSLQPPNDKHQLDSVRRVSPRYRQHIHAVSLDVPTRHTTTATWLAYVQVVLAKSWHRPGVPCGNNARFVHAIRGARETLQVRPRKDAQTPTASRLRDSWFGCRDEQSNCSIIAIIRRLLKHNQ